MPDWMQTPQFWLSLALSLAGCTGLLLAGRGKVYGWVIGLAIQPVWALFGWITGGYGLILNSLMYGYVYWTNFARWRRDHRREVESMGLTKHGHGQVLREPGDTPKTAARSTWDAEDAEQLAAENAEADGADKS